MDLRTFSPRPAPDRPADFHSRPAPPCPAPRIFASAPPRSKMLCPAHPWFQYCLDGLNAVRTISILSILSLLSKLSGKFYYPLLYVSRGDLRAFSYVATGDLRTFYMSREVYLRVSSGNFLRVKSCCRESLYLIPGKIITCNF